MLVRREYGRVTERDMLLHDLAWLKASEVGLEPRDSVSSRGHRDRLSGRLRPPSNRDARFGLFCLATLPNEARLLRGCLRLRLAPLGRFVETAHGGLGRVRVASNPVVELSSQSGGISSGAIRRFR
jgi:hypothetical protein